MGFLATQHDNWKVLNWARESVAAKVGTAITSYDVNTYLLAYSGTWTDTTAAPLNAQNPANWPTELAKKVPIWANGVRLRFLIADANDENTALIFWGKDSSGAPLNLFTISPCQAGSAICDQNPQDGKPLRHLAFTNGSIALLVQDTITGGTSNATARVEKVVVTSGTWAAGTAAGIICISGQSGTFQAEAITATGGGIASIAADSVYFYYADTLTVTTPAGAENWSYSSVGTTNGIRELRLDLRGISELFCDFDVQNGTDAICLYKYY